MLPGFRFLLAAIVLSVSILVFGLGAAALLRAAHEEFASAPAWRVAPEPKFARQNDLPKEASREPPKDEPMPVLAMLRVEPEPARPGPAVAEPAEPPAIAPALELPGKIAALEPPDKTLPEATQAAIPVPEIPVESEAPAADIPALAEGARIAAVEQASPPANEALAPAPETAIVPSAVDTDLIAAKIATLGGPPVAIETQRKGEVVSVKPDRSAARKRLQAQRAKERRAQRARAARRAAARQAAAQQQAADPFAQPTITTRSR